MYIYAWAATSFMCNSLDALAALHVTSFCDVTFRKQVD